MHTYFSMAVVYLGYQLEVNSNINFLFYKKKHQHPINLYLLNKCVLYNLMI